MAGFESLIATIVVGVLMQLLAVIALGLREYSRRLRKQKLGSDMYTLLVALIVAFSIDGIVIYYSFHGLAINSIADVIQHVDYWRETLWISELVTDLAPGLALFTSDVGTIVDALLYHGRIQIFAAVTDIVLDICVLLLPSLVIKGLQMDKKRKISVIGLFWLGAFCILSSIMRLYYILETFEDFRAANLTDIGVVADLLIWTHIEPSGSIVAACLLMLGPVWNHPRIKTFFRRKSATTNTYPARQNTYRPSQRDGWTELGSDGIS